jgi:hypothetical protein
MRPCVPRRGSASKARDYSNRLQPHDARSLPGHNNDGQLCEASFACFFVEQSRAPNRARASVQRKIGRRQFDFDAATLPPSGYDRWDRVQINVRRVYYCVTKFANVGACICALSPCGRGLHWARSKFGSVRGPLRLTQTQRPPHPFLSVETPSSPLPQPKSGTPDFGHTIGRPKSETSDFGWERAQIWAPSFLTQ